MTIGPMAFSVPHRRLADEFARVFLGGRRLGDLVDRNFAEIEGGVTDALDRLTTAEGTLADVVYGTFSATTDSSGFVTVTHGAPFTPSIVIVSPKSPIGGPDIFGMAIADSYTSTTFRVRCIGNTGGALVNVAVTGSFLVHV